MSVGLGESLDKGKETKNIFLVDKTLKTLGYTCWILTHTFKDRDRLKYAMILPSAPNGAIDPSAKIADMSMMERVDIFRIAKEFIEAEHELDPSQPKKHFDQDGYDKAIQEKEEEELEKE